MVFAFKSANKDEVKGVVSPPSMAEPCPRSMVSNVKLRFILANVNENRSKATAVERLQETDKACPRSVYGKRKLSCTGTIFVCGFRHALEGPSSQTRSWLCRGIRG